MQSKVPNTLTVQGKYGALYSSNTLWKNEIKNLENRIQSYMNMLHIFLNQMKFTIEI